MRVETITSVHLWSLHTDVDDYMCQHLDHGHCMESNDIENQRKSVNQRKFSKSFVPRWCCNCMCYIYIGIYNTTIEIYYTTIASTLSLPHNGLQPHITKLPLVNVTYNLI